MSSPQVHLGGTDWTLLTGATGFIGQHLLARLLQQNRRVLLGVRGEPSAAWQRLLAMPTLADLDLQRRQQRGEVRLLRVELGTPIDLPSTECVSSIVHAAGSVRFSATPDGDPHRTNVAGTQHLLDWAAGRGVPGFHLISTAYVCGQCDIGAEAVAGSPPVARNDYETSKWLSEVAARRWADATGGSLTIHRPSIVVGEFATGAASKFDGFYLILRALHQVSRRFGQGDQPMPVRIEGSAAGRENIVPVDWVAGLIAGIVSRPELHGRVYNLVNAHPPTNGQLKSTVEALYPVDLHFVDPPAFRQLSLTLGERVFSDLGRELCPYVNSNQHFARANTELAESVLALPCPVLDDAALRRLVRFAVESRFGRRPVRDLASPWCAEYFERFLPQMIPHCRLVQAAAMDVTVRFAVGDAPDDSWMCRFEQGRLAHVGRAGTGGEDVAFVAADRAFWQVVSGRCDPQELFQRGESEIVGDIEKGLKVAFLFQSFAQQFPCDQAALAASRARRSA